MTHHEPRPRKHASAHEVATASTSAVLASSESEGLYRALIGAVLDPTVVIDAHGIVVTASDSVEKIFGWKPADLRGRNVSVLMPEPHANRHDGYLANYRRTGETQILGRTREFEVLHKNGQRLICELSVARADIPGREPLFIGSFRDITARRQAERALEESDRRFRAIFDRSYEYIGLLEPDGTLLEANRTALDAVGATRDEVVGRKFWDTPWWSLSEPARQKLREAIAQAAGGKFVRFETVFRGAGDELLTVDFSINPVRDSSGQVNLLIPEGRNITDLKRAQRAETSMLRALATIGESAAVLAHEIKNPITAVNVALRAVAHQLGEDHRAVLEDLSGRMQRLETLMRRTLSFAKPLELRVVRIAPDELLGQTLKQSRAEIVKRGVDARAELGQGSLDFEGDRQLLEEVLTNLLRNALEAVQPQGRIVLSAQRTDDGSILLAVDDDGPGIPERLRASLFKPFVTTKDKGTGLGLAFCRKVIEEHGGTIDATTSTLGGARFEIRVHSLG